MGNAFCSAALQQRLTLGGSHSLPLPSAVPRTNTRAGFAPHSTGGELSNLARWKVGVASQVALAAGAVGLGVAGRQRRSGCSRQAARSRGLVTSRSDGHPVGEAAANPRRRVLWGSAGLLSALYVGLVASSSEVLAITREEKMVTDLFKLVTPSVVSISKNKPQASGADERAGAIYGSGFVWDKHHVVTNYHVIQGMEKPYVTFLGKDEASGGERRTTLDASIVGVDAASDVAVLRVGARSRDADTSSSASVMKPLRKATSTNLLVGQDVFAFGNPFGLEHSLSRGIISGVARTMEGAGGRPIQNIIQTDASINPGNSGGPLIDSGGEVIGVNTAILSGSGTFSGVGLAIPIDTVKDNVESIIAKGFVRRPFLGIVFAPDIMVEELDLKGIMVMKVVPGGPADQAGLRPMRGGRLGDILTSIDGTQVGASDDLFKLLDRKQPGDDVRMLVRRPSTDANSDGFDEVRITVRLGATPQENQQSG